MKTDPGMIDIDDDNLHDDRPVEVPVFTIESGDDKPVDSSVAVAGSPQGWNRLFIFDVIVLILLAVCILLWASASRGWRYPDVTCSVTDDENIAMLKNNYSAHSMGTVHTSDSVLGVAFDMFSLSGLKASLERTIPSPDDENVVLFMRSADYLPDGTWIGKVVIDGEKFAGKGGKTRYGYVAISKEGKLTAGISGSNKVADFSESAGGSFFRQFVLLGDGELPSKFKLHGKVERAAIGRLAGGELYYIVTRNKETMYDFADALREYGFLDAVYITGGNNYNFYRDTEGVAHSSQSVDEKIEKYRDTIPPAPFLVFRNN